MNAPQHTVDTVVGVTAAAGGSTGVAVQMITQYANLGLLFVNFLVAVGGLYLLWLRIRRAHRADLRERMEWNGIERRGHERRDSTFN